MPDRKEAGRTLIESVKPMLCDACGRNNAVIHIVQAGPNGRVERDLCEECARNYSEYLLPFGKKDVSVNDFLKGVFSAPPEVQPKEEHKDGKELVCPKCGMSYEDFRKTGKIGCAVCYKTFRHQLLPLLRRIHGASTHSGKIPHRSGSKLELKQRVERLREDLKQAVVQEEYEKAAELRDDIRALETEMEEKGSESDVAK